MIRKKMSFDPAFTSRPVFSGDIDEVRYLKMFAAEHRGAAAPQKRSSKPQEPLLIDIVTPQPKAFFAYLQMPPKPSKKSTPKRVRRHRKVQ